MMKLVTRLTLLFFFMAATASALLYHTSYQVQDLRAQQRALGADILAEQNAIRVLQAEWAYLAEPGRIERLAATHLGLQKIATHKDGVRLQTAATFAVQPKTAARLAVAAAPKPATATKIKTAVAAPKAAVAATVASATPSTSTPPAVGVLLASFMQ